MTAGDRDHARAQEAAWAAAAVTGDRRALERLLDALYDEVRAVCRRVCADPTDGDDATQVALMSIVRALPGFDGRAAVRTWAHRIAVNAALDEVRRRGRRPAPVDEVPERAGHGPEFDQRVADRQALDAALADLPVDFRTAVVLRDVVGMDYADIAESVGVPVGTVRSRINRGRRQLADRLGIVGNRTTATGVGSEEP